VPQGAYLGTVRAAAPKGGPVPPLLAAAPAHHGSVLPNRFYLHQRDNQSPGLEGPLEMHTLCEHDPLTGFPSVAGLGVEAEVSDHPSTDLQTVEGTGKGAGLQVMGSAPTTFTGVAAPLSPSGVSGLSQRSSVRSRPGRMVILASGRSAPRSGIRGATSRSGSSSAATTAPLSGTRQPATRSPGTPGM
jgi:hypothetical protein